MMMPARRGVLLAACASAALALALAGAVAQTSQRPAATTEVAKREAATPPAGQGPPNALQGFSQNRDKPVHIEASELEVRDKQKVATFKGNVHLIQGDTDMRCKTLDVHYEDDSAQPGVVAAQPGPGGQQKIKRLEAKGGVVVTQKDQTVTGQNGTFDMKSNTVTVVGNVVMSQGRNVLMGERLIVDLSTGVSKVDDGKGGQGRVKGLFHQGEGGPQAPTLTGSTSPVPLPGAAAKPAAPAAAPAKDGPKPPAGKPLRLN
jgi:lipopolysaccharide export system protein LptA